jgi:hypothetical protein
MKSRIRLEVRLHGQPDGVEAEALEDAHQRAALTGKDLGKGRPLSHVYLLAWQRKSSAMGAFAA